MLNFNFLQFREILGILSNTVAEVATSFDSEGLQFWGDHHLILPVTEIPEWLKFNHHQSVGNFVSFLVGPKFSNLVICIAFPSKDMDSDLEKRWIVNFSINGKKRTICIRQWANSNSDHVWLIY